MKEELIFKYKERLKMLKTNLAIQEAQTKHGLTDEDRQDFENQIRLTAEFIKDLKKL